MPVIKQLQVQDLMSPTKQQIMNIFRTSPGIPPNIKLDTVSSKPSTYEPNVKKVIPRLKQVVYGEVLTTEDILNQMKQKQEE